MLVEIDLETTRVVCYTIREIIGQESSIPGGKCLSSERSYCIQKRVETGEQREMYDLGQKACSGMRKMENIRMFILNGMEIIWLYGAITMGMGKIW